MNRRLASPTPTPACTTPHDRLVAAARLAAPNLPTAVDNALHAVSLAEPAALQRALRDQLAAHAGPALVAGTLDRRLVLIKRRHKAERGAARWVAADLSGKAHQTRAWPAWTSRDAHLHLDRPQSWLSHASLDDQAVYRLTRPRVLLVALYHPEHFPLPRFPLAISDLARAARAALLGQVSLLDMQLGVALEDILDAVTTRRPDVLGISATFGQHDLMVRLLDTVIALPTRPLIVAGGSLTKTSCRVDQVVRLDQDRDWHLDRAAMWRRLCALGLRRCLFGVESGVDSVLERFNKETTGEQTHSPSGACRRSACRPGSPTSPSTTS